MEFKPEYLNNHFHYENKNLYKIHDKISHVGLLTFLWSKMENLAQCHYPIDLYDKHTSFEKKLILTDSNDYISTSQYIHNENVITKLYDYWYNGWKKMNQDTERDSYRIDSSSNDELWDISLFTHHDTRFYLTNYERKIQVQSEKKLYLIFKNTSPSISEKYFALMIITNRIRNNIFHGVKEAENFKSHQTIINIACLCLHFFTSHHQNFEIDSNLIKFVEGTSFNKEFDIEIEKKLTKIEFSDGNTNSIQALKIFTTLYGFMESICFSENIKNLRDLIKSFDSSEIRSFQINSDNISLEKTHIQFKSWYNSADLDKGYILFKLKNQELQLFVKETQSVKQFFTEGKHIKRTAKDLLQNDSKILKAFRESIFHGKDGSNKWIMESQFIDNNSFLLAILIKSYVRIKPQTQI